MATISFDDKVVIVNDKRKAKEIQKALLDDKRAFAEVKPAVDDTKVKEDVKKWFCR